MEGLLGPRVRTTKVKQILNAFKMRNKYLELPLDINYNRQSFYK